MRRPTWKLLLVLAALGTHSVPAARAGGGPENVLLVVNSASWASQTVANQFVRLRQIPPCNVVTIDWDGGVDSTDVESFREKILGPVLQHVQSRGLADHIDYIVYSSDFPTAVDLTPDLHGQKLLDSGSAVCSINSATYFYSLVMGHNPNAIGLKANHYMRAFRGDPRAPTHGFRSWYGWGSGGELLEAGGQHYMLSTMLAVTSGRGNSVGEALRYLRASAKADGTHPNGTIYYMRNSGIRSTTRELDPDGTNHFVEAVGELKKLGVAAMVLPGDVPAGKPDVQGTMIGVRDFSWRRSGSTILPGAICDNLTSFGGEMSEGAGQTPLSELLRYGAAGASGTVVEPFAVQEKFPVPAIHVHYARGCTLAEAFYQSVFGPWQLLIVGDPLCRPWANIPAVEVDGLPGESSVSGTLTLKPRARASAGTKVDRFELFVDGKRFARCGAGQPLALDTSILADGYHELRIVAIESSPIESQGRLVVPITVNNRGHSIEFTASAKKSIGWDESLRLQAKAPGMAGVLFFHNGRPLGKIIGDEGEAEIKPRALGTGPVVLEAIGVVRGGPQNFVFARPIHLTVQSGAALAAMKKAPANLARGMELKLASGKTVPVEETQNPNWLAKAGVKEREPFELSGYFDVPARNVYQFQVWYYGDLKVTVDEQVLHDGHGGAYRQTFLPLALAPGVHRLSIIGRTGERAQLRVAFGGPGALSLNGETFRHAE